MDINGYRWISMDGGHWESGTGPGGPLDPTRPRVLRVGGSWLRSWVPREEDPGISLNYPAERWHCELSDATWDVLQSLVALTLSFPSCLWGSFGALCFGCCGRVGLSKTSRELSPSRAGSLAPPVNPKSHPGEPGMFIPGGKGATPAALRGWGLSLKSA